MLTADNRVKQHPEIFLTTQEGPLEMRKGLNQKADRIQPSPIRKILSKTQTARMQGIHVTDLSVGRPDFDTPAHIKEAARRAMDQGQVHYTASAGIPELRESICRQAGAAFFHETVAFE